MHTSFVCLIYDNMSLFLSVTSLNTKMYLYTGIILGIKYTLFKCLFFGSWSKFLFDRNPNWKSRVYQLLVYVCTNNLWHVSMYVQIILLKCMVDVHTCSLVTDWYNVISVYILFTSTEGRGLVAANKQCKGKRRQNAPWSVPASPHAGVQLFDWSITEMSCRGTHHNQTWFIKKWILWCFAL